MVAVVPAAIQVTPGASNTAGACWYQQPYTMVDNFQVSFQFHVTWPATNGVPADGFAFVRRYQDCISISVNIYILLLCCRSYKPTRPRFSQTR
jgi:hypothetical protein